MVPAVNKVSKVSLGSSTTKELISSSSNNEHIVQKQQSYLPNQLALVQRLI